MSFAKTEMPCVVAFSSAGIILLVDIMSNACALQGIPFLHAVVKRSCKVLIV